MIFSAELQDSGISVSSVAEIDSTQADSFAAEASRAIVALLSDHDGSFLSREYTVLLRLGVVDSLLATAEAYLEDSPALSAVHLRRDSGSALREDLGGWHLDSEADRMLRLIIYLTDVPSAGGPFEYVPAAFGHRCAHLRTTGLGDISSNPSYELIDDAMMASSVPREHWRACTGPAFTAVLVDTARLFHHVKAFEGERLSITYTYLAQAPSSSLGPRNPVLDDVLSARQRACFFADTRA